MWRTYPGLWLSEGVVGLRGRRHWACRHHTYRAETSTSVSASVHCRTVKASHTGPLLVWWSRHPRLMHVVSRWPFYSFSRPISIPPLPLTHLREPWEGARRTGRCVGPRCWGCPAWPPHSTPPDRGSRRGQLAGPAASAAAPAVREEEARPAEAEEEEALDDA